MSYDLAYITCILCVYCIFCASPQRSIYEVTHDCAMKSYGRVVV